MNEALTIRDTVVSLHLHTTTPPHINVLQMNKLLKLQIEVETTQSSWETLKHKHYSEMKLKYPGCIWP